MVQRACWVKFLAQCSVFCSLVHLASRLTSCQVLLPFLVLFLGCDKLQHSFSRLATQPLAAVWRHQYWSPIPGRGLLACRPDWPTSYCQLLKLGPTCSIRVPEYSMHKTNLFVSRSYLIQTLNMDIHGLIRSGTCACAGSGGGNCLPRTHGSSHASTTRLPGSASLTEPMLAMKRSSHLVSASPALPAQTPEQRRS